MSDSFFPPQLHPQVRSPTSEEIARYLRTRNPFEMAQLVQSINEPAAQAEITKSLLAAPPSVTSGRGTHAPVKAKKALNAFIAFRSYYIKCPQFYSWPQMKVSKNLSMMWEADPHKPIWTLIAKAWSIIRDQTSNGKVPITVLDFCIAICAHLKLPSQDDYLQTMGWEVYLSEEEQAPRIHRKFHPAPESLEVPEVAATLSVEGIINYCQSMGLVQDHVFDTNSTSSTFLGSYMSVHEGRVAARNKRRARRQDMRDSGIAPAMQKQIAAAHGFDTVAEFDLPFEFGVDASFFDDVHKFMSSLDTDVFQPSYGSSTGVNQTSTAEGAFRVGADEEATLPYFDSTNI